MYVDSKRCEYGFMALGLGGSLSDFKRWEYLLICGVRLWL